MEFTRLLTPTVSEEHAPVPRRRWRSFDVQALHSEFCLHILLHSDGPSTFPTLPPEGSVATPIPVSCFPSFTLHSVSISGNHPPCAILTSRKQHISWRSKIG